MHARLARYENGVVQEQFMLEERVTSVGRELGNTVQLMSKVVSKRHARITEAGTGWEIEDLGSRNGVFVNGKQIRKAKRLANRDKVSFGGLEFMFEMTSSPSDWQHEYVIDNSTRAADVTLQGVKLPKKGFGKLFGK